MTETNILKGCCDMHLHVAPSMMKRVTDIVGVARQAEAAGYRAIVIKDHHCNSAPACDQIKRHLFSQSNLDIFGSISLNNAVGGINVYSVEAAIGFGVRVVWMPTVSAAAHINFHGGKGSFPSTSLSLEESPMVLTDENGRLKPEVVEVLRSIARNPQVVLATGHASAAEINAVIEKAVELGVRHIMVDHPTFGLGATIEQIKYWASLGCWIENCGTISDPRNSPYGIPYNEIADLIRIIGVDKCIMSSDYGQAKFGDCIEGMDSFIHAMRLEGFTDAELRTMCCDNPARILSLS